MEKMREAAEAQRVEALAKRKVARELEAAKKMHKRVLYSYACEGQSWSP